MLNLSTLITCRNKERFLDDCISSVLRQTKEPKEIIVVHDECKEPVHHAEVTTIMLKTNLGVQRARHEAFRYSTGELILFLDGDDMLSPDYLEKMTLAIAGGAAISYPDLYFFGATGKKLVVSPAKLEAKFIMENSRIPIPVTCLMKREVYEKLKGFKDFPVMEDMDFWLRALCNDYTFQKAETLLWYRQESDTRNSIEMSKRKRIVGEIIAQFSMEGEKIVCKL